MHWLARLTVTLLFAYPTFGAAADEFHGVWSYTVDGAGESLGLYQVGSAVCGYWTSGNRARVENGYLYGTVKNARLRFRQCEASGFSSERDFDCPSFDKTPRLVWLNDGKLGYYIQHPPGHPLKGWRYETTYLKMAAKPNEAAFDNDLRALCKSRSNISVEKDALNPTRLSPKR